LEENSFQPCLAFSFYLACRDFRIYSKTVRRYKDNLQNEKNKSEIDLNLDILKLEDDINE